jgi:hypothetical protein
VRVGKVQLRWLAAFALLAVVVAAHADYKDNYAHGLEAYNGGDYAKARTLMQQALDEHADPAARIRLYGQRFEPYLPQHYLGMVAFKQGDCSTALSQWGSAENRQIVSQLPEIGGEEQRDSATCEQKVAKKDDKSTKQQTTAPEVPPPAKTTVADKPPAKPVAPPVKPAEPPAPKPPVEKPPVAAKNAPPEPLVQAFDNYLGGRYTEAVRINPDSYADTRARFHAYLVRAASKYILSRISADEEMLKSARADVLAARALDARIEPDATLFSPGFRAFYQESH